MQTEEQKRESWEQGYCNPLLLHVLQVLTTLQEKIAVFRLCEWLSVVNGRVDAEPMNAN